MIKKHQMGQEKLGKLLFGVGGGKKNFSFFLFQFFFRHFLYSFYILFVMMKYFPRLLLVESEGK